MVFASLPFIFFILPLFLVCTFLSKKYVTLRNILLCLVSLFFYVFDGSFHSLKILLAYGILNFIFGYVLELSKSLNNSKIKLFTLILFVTINVCGLVFYKYTYWLVSIISDTGLLGQLSVKKQTLPLGISFFTFHAVSYLIDIYRGEISGKTKVINFLTYFFMFPHLIAGPIVRYKQIKDDVATVSCNSELFTYGIYRFILGVNKKILIANSVAPLANMAFGYHIDAISPQDAWIGAIAYMLQIYFDFSAYSDMAIGLAAMGGFRFSENFNAPYVSSSIKEFWRRWHISLSSWLRDYVYIPLGGSRVKTSRIYFNLVFVFFLCGLWHGANTTFIVWGLYNGLFLVLERVWLGNKLDKLPKFITRSYALIVVLIGWVFFRAENLSQAIDYLQTMFFITNSSNNSICNGEFLNYLALIAGCAIALFKLNSFDSSNAKDCKIHKISLLTNFVLVIVSITILYFGSQNPFIYFNF